MREQVNDDYEYAHAGPEQFDCSGLGYYCYGVATGTPLPPEYRSSEMQAKMGAKVAPDDDLEPGDAIIFSGGDIPARGHVGYVLDPHIPTMVNALNEEKGVIISDLNSDYWKGKTWEIRRWFSPRAEDHEISRDSFQAQKKEAYAETKADGELVLPTGNVDILRSGGGGTYGDIPWQRVEQYLVHMRRAVAKYPVVPLWLQIAMGLIESDWNQFNPDGSVLIHPYDGDKNGFRARGMFGVKEEYWQYLDPGANADQIGGNAMLSAAIMAEAMKSRTWQQAIAEVYHPGEDPNSHTRPRGYVATVEKIRAALEGVNPVPATDLPVIEAIIPKSNYNRPGTIINPTFLTIHETANTNVGANAKMHRDFVAQGGGPETVSFHYVVDDHEAYHLIPNNEMAWHAGDGCDDPVNDIGCFGSIATEICVNSDGNWETTLRNAAKLQAKLIRGNKQLSRDRVRQHNKWSGKDCPHIIRSTGRWEAFLGMIDAELVGTTPGDTTPVFAGLPDWLPSDYLVRAFPLADPKGAVTKKVIEVAKAKVVVPIFIEKLDVAEGRNIWRFEDFALLNEGTKVWLEGETPPK